MRTRTSSSHDPRLGARRWIIARHGSVPGLDGAERPTQLSQVGQVAPLTGEIAVPRCTVLLPPLAAGGVDLRTREQEGSEGTWDGNGVRDREASGEPRARPHAAATQGWMDGTGLVGWVPD